MYMLLILISFSSGVLKVNGIDEQMQLGKNLGVQDLVLNDIMQIFGSVHAIWYGTLVTGFTLSGIKHACTNSLDADFH